MDLTTCLILFVISCSLFSCSFPQLNKELSGNSDTGITRTGSINTLSSLDSCKMHYLQLSEEYNKLRSTLSTPAVLSGEIPSISELNYQNMPDPGIKLYIPDPEFYDGPEIKDGEHFWGVYFKREEGQLQYYMVKKVPVKHLPSEEERIFYGIDSAYGKPIFLFNGMNPKNPENLPGLEFKSGFFMPGETKEILLSDQTTCTIYAIGSFTLENDTINTNIFNAIRNYKLKARILKNYKFAGEFLLCSRDNIYYPDVTWANDEIEPFILWAGDLDGDEQLDLVAGTGIKSCVTYTLYLSSRAEKGRHLKPVAEMSSCGC